ncbi:hypothetical protein [Methylorubrum thiocyanatum]|uniref:hypothetical protein n=1 Tax=Methylorubrum thiocyanatum TaxID=47958 RepID=UPI003F7F16EE
MRITLWPVPPEIPVVGTPVGFMGGGPATDLAGRAPRPGLPVLSYEGRQPLVDGKPVPHDEIGEALQAEVERVAKRLFGAEYSGPLAAATGLNVRSVQRGRVLTHGLPAPVLAMLARSIATPCPRATGHMLLAVAALWDSLLPEYGVGEVGPGPLSTDGRELMARRLDKIAAQAIGLVVGVQEDAAAAKARAYAAAGRNP